MKHYKGSKKVICNNCKNIWESRTTHYKFGRTMPDKCPFCHKKGMIREIKKEI